ncbi:MAG: enoyl-CoA hydratase/isomerase family protein [Rhodobacter sp.]|nr:enoyl-CoA hydratase/isomerase family protein [Rhodobacter sp.]
MTATVRQTRNGAVMVLTIDSPPVNALGAAVRAGLAEGLAAAQADPSVGAIVRCAVGANFSAGADIREFGRPAPRGVPGLPELCNRIEASGKAVVAAIEGTALGGGLELALAAHVRLAGPRARLGFPEVALGLLPGAGGTQRMPRLTGAGPALRLMLTGKPVPAQEALAIGLVDAVVEDAEQTAVALAADLAAGRKTPVPTRDRQEGLRDAARYQAEVLSARAGTAGRLPAPGRIVDCVEAALLLPFDRGLVLERAAFEDLAAGPESAGLRRAFFAERRVAVFPEADARANPVSLVGLVGLGATGAAIAALLLQAGLRVAAVVKGSGPLDAGLRRVSALLDQAEAAGRLSPEARAQAQARLSSAPELTALAGCELVIEALPEDEALKASVLGKLGQILRPGSVITTTVSWLDPARLALATGRPADVVGLHLCPPAERMRLAELGVSSQTRPEAVATLAALMRRIGKLPVRVGAAAGLVGNRVMAALRTAADLLLEEGASPSQVDAALQDFGFAMGPYRALDLAGLKRAWAHRQRESRAGRPGYGGDLADMLVGAGRLGQVTGRGYYLHDGQGVREDPEVLGLLGELRSAKGIAPRRIGSDEIRLRCLGAMANEAAKVLGEGLAQRPGDIDAILLAGYGFPRWRGGPMAWAADRGLLVLRADLRLFAPQAPEFWAVAPLIDDLIREERHLDDLDMRPVSSG